MKKAAYCLATILVWTFGAGVASAQSDKPWNGAYIGVNAGATRNDTCTRATLNGTAADSVGGTSFSGCAGGGFVGGAQIGDNFQSKRLVWGVGADIDIWSAKKYDQTFKSIGKALPSGTYAYSGRLSPNDFAIVGARAGYAGDLLLPYFRVGAIITTGSAGSAVSYTPLGAAKPTASFSGGKNPNSAGWAAGGGTEIGLNGAWSITVDYLHVNLGGPSNAAAICSGSASACAAFSGVSLDSSRSGFTANIFRIGINHWFGYWQP